MRCLLIEAALHVSPNLGPCAATTGGCPSRKGKLKRVALAHKRVGVIYHVWKDQTDYHAFLQHEVGKRMSSNETTGPAGPQP